MSSLKKNGSTHAWRKLRQQILDRDGYQCAYCGSPEANTVDHIVPRDKGGTDHPENLVAACQRCNREKSNKSQFFLRGETPRPHLSLLSPTVRLKPSETFESPELP